MKVEPKDSTKSKRSTAVHSIVPAYTAGARRESHSAIQQLENPGPNQYASKRPQQFAPLPAYIAPTPSSMVIGTQYGAQFPPTPAYTSQPFGAPSSFGQTHPHFYTHGSTPVGHPGFGAPFPVQFTPAAFGGHPGFHYPQMNGLHGLSQPVYYPQGQVITPPATSANSESTEGSATPTQRSHMPIVVETPSHV